MRMAAESVQHWPIILSAVRVMVNFLRVTAWRRVCQGELLKLRKRDMSEQLERFSANLAKWRYETYHDVFRDLGKLSSFCQEYLSNRIRAWFSQFEDKTLLSSVEYACNWPMSNCGCVLCLEFVKLAINKFKIDQVRHLFIGSTFIKFDTHKVKIGQARHSYAQN